MKGSFFPTVKMILLKALSMGDSSASSATFQPRKTCLSIPQISLLKLVSSSAVLNIVTADRAQAELNHRLSVQPSAQSEDAKVVAMASGPHTFCILTVRDFKFFSSASVFQVGRDVYCDIAN